MKENLKAKPKDRAPEPEKTKGARKKKYDKPAVIYQAPLEAMAATCSVLGKLPGPCSSNTFS